MTKDGLIIVSGGMDSVTMLYEYRDSISLGLSFHYGSKHNDREISFARLHCERLGIEHQLISLPFVDELFNSSLLRSGGDIPEGSYGNGNMRSTVVPFRNGIMLSIAAGLAESRGMSSIYIANHGGDHAIYPDCRSNFIAAMNDAVGYGTYGNIRIVAPYTGITKTDVARRGKELGVDYSLTWSCYKGGDHPCGVCGTCIERREALMAIS